MVTASNVLGWKRLVELAEKHERAGESFKAGKRLLSAVYTDEISRMGKGSEQMNVLLKRAVENLAKNDHTANCRSLEFMQRGRLILMLSWSDPWVNVLHFCCL